MRVYKYISMRISASLFLFGMCAFSPGVQTAAGAAIVERSENASCRAQAKHRSLRQSPQNVNVRPRVAAPQPGIPIVKATADRRRVPLGELVTFTLTPASVVSDSRYTVTIYFGDRQHEPVTQPKLTHLYLRTGTFTYSILVRSLSPKAPLAVPTVELSATPTSVETGALVNFKANPSHSYPNLKYRFVFADGTPSNWQDDPATTHRYRPSGTYRPYVDIGSGNPGSITQLGGSLRRKIIVSSPRPGPIAVELTADRFTIPAKTEVNFLARSDSRDASVRYRFVFGDGSGPNPWQPSARAKHFYPFAGSYPAYVEVSVLNPSAQQARSRTLSIEVAPAPRPPADSIDLFASPRSIPEGFPVYFRAISDSRKPNARYRFNFGDGSPTSWRATSETVHVYVLAGTYRTFVEVSRANDPIAASGMKQITVTRFIGPPLGPTPVPSPSAPPSPAVTATPSNSPVSSPSPNASVTPFASPNASPTIPATTSPSPSPTASPSVSPSPSPPTDSGPWDDWWKYLPLVPLVLFGGYQGWKYFYAPRPTLETRPDPGAAAVGTEGGPLGINFQMELDPNVGDGEFSVDTSGKTLIKSERKSDG